MAGRESQWLRNMSPHRMDEAAVDTLLRRVVHAPGWRDLIHTGGKSQWIVQANVMPTDDPRYKDFMVRAEIMLERYQIEITVPITKGIEDFLGPANWTVADIITDDPDGPVCAFFAREDIPGMSMCPQIFRVPQVKPYLAFDVGDAEELALAMKLLFKIPDVLPPQVELVDMFAL